MQGLPDSAQPASQHTQASPAPIRAQRRAVSPHGILSLQGRLADYQVGPTLASSDAAILVEVRDQLERVFVAKIIQPHIRLHESLVDEVARHQQLFKTVRSASRWAVPVLDSGIAADGRSFYVMPRYHEPLVAHARSASPLLLRLDLLVQACATVEYLHGVHPERPQIHGNLHFHNFLLQQRGSRWAVHMSDLGIMKRASDAREIEGIPRGRTGFAAPEQRSPESHLDQSVDVYALASMIFQMCTGDGPPRSTDPHDEEHTVPEASLAQMLQRNRPSEHALGPSLTAPAQHLGTGLTRPLMPYEEEQLRFALEDALRHEVDDLRAASLAEELSRLLTPLLLAALHPEASQRTVGAGVMRRQLIQAYNLVASAMGAPPWRPVPSATREIREAVPRPAAAPDRATLSPEKPATPHALILSVAALSMMSMGFALFAATAADLGHMQTSATQQIHSPEDITFASLAQTEETARIGLATPMAPTASTQVATLAASGTHEDTTTGPRTRSESTTQRSLKTTPASKADEPKPRPSAAPVTLEARIHVPRGSTMRAPQGEFEAGIHTLRIASSHPTRVTLRGKGKSTTFTLLAQPYQDQARLIVRRAGRPLLSRAGLDGGSVAIALHAEGYAQVP